MRNWPSSILGELDSTELTLSLALNANLCQKSKNTGLPSKSRIPAKANQYLFQHQNARSWIAMASQTRHAIPDLFPYPSACNVQYVPNPQTPRSLLLSTHLSRFLEAVYYHLLYTNSLVFLSPHNPLHRRFPPPFFFSDNTQRWISTLSIQPPYALSS